MSEAKLHAINPLEIIESMRNESRPVTFLNNYRGEVKVQPKFDRAGQFKQVELDLIKMELAGASVGFRSYFFKEWMNRSYDPSLAMWDVI